MGNIQLKDVPEEIHDELRRRAEQAETTLRDYVLDLINRDLALPSQVDWLRSVRRLERARTKKPAADLIRDQRSFRGRRR